MRSGSPGASPSAVIHRRPSGPVVSEVGSPIDSAWRPTTPLAEMRPNSSPPLDMRNQAQPSAVTAMPVGALSDGKFATLPPRNSVTAPAVVTRATRPGLVRSAIHIASSVARAMAPGGVLRPATGVAVGAATAVDVPTAHSRLHAAPNTPQRRMTVPSDDRART